MHRYTLRLRQCCTYLQINFNGRCVWVLCLDAHKFKCRWCVLLLLLFFSASHCYHCFVHTFTHILLYSICHFLYFHLFFFFFSKQQTPSSQSTDTINHLICIPPCAIVHFVVATVMQMLCVVFVGLSKHHRKIHSFIIP